LLVDPGAVFGYRPQPAGGAEKQMLGFAFLAAVVGVVLAVAFWFQWQSAARAVLALRAEADASRKEADAARSEQKRAIEELKAQKAIVLETREKLTEARKKAQEGKSGKMQSRGAREAELEEDLGHARKLLEDAHAAEQQARKDLLAAKAVESHARAELDRAQVRIRELSNQPAPAARAAAPAAELEVARTQLEAAKAELERQVHQAEHHARESKRREQELREEIRKHKGRAETNNRVFIVTKGELELTKERLAQAEHKLWQAGIPLTPPAAKERPKATGPAAAEKAPEPADPDAEPAPNAKV
jgi:chromosome segregation ATPase